MGAVNRPEYESLEFEPAEKGPVTSETSAGPLKHNGSLVRDGCGFPGERPALDSRNTSTTSNDGKRTYSSRQIRIPRQPRSLTTAIALIAALTGKALEEEPIWKGLWESIQDLFFPQEAAAARAHLHADSRARPHGRQSQPWSPSASPPPSISPSCSSCSSSSARRSLTPSTSP